MYFTYGDLKKEVPFSSDFVVVAMPGQVTVPALKAASGMPLIILRPHSHHCEMGAISQVVMNLVAFSRAKALRQPAVSSGGFLQCDDGVRWDRSSNTVTHVAGEAVDPMRVYQVLCPSLWNSLFL